MNMLNGILEVNFDVKKKKFKECKIGYKVWNYIIYKETSIYTKQ